MKTIFSPVQLITFVLNNESTTASAYVTEMNIKLTSLLFFKNILAGRLFNRVTYLPRTPS